MGEDKRFRSEWGALINRRSAAAPRHGLEGAGSGLLPTALT